MYQEVKDMSDITKKVDATKAVSISKTAADLKLDSPAVAFDAKTRFAGDLNIVLDKTSLNRIVEILGPKLIDLGKVALASDYCCVDASVGSSVAGPASSVASSVSMSGLDRTVNQKITTQDIRLTVSLPQDITIK